MAAWYVLTRSVIKIKKEPKNAPEATLTISFVLNSASKAIVPRKENIKEKKALAARLVITKVSKSLTGSIRAIKNAVNIPTSNKLSIGT